MPANVVEGRRVNCAYCGKSAVWMVSIRMRPWFRPNREDDGSAQICDACWNAR